MLLRQHFSSSPWNAARSRCQLSLTPSLFQVAGLVKMDWQALLQLIDLNARQAKVPYVVSMG